MINEIDLIHVIKQKYSNLNKFFSARSKYKRTIIEWLFLFMIFIFSVLLRTRYPVYDLNDDIGRDIYVAKNFFSDHNSSIFIRPNSTLRELPNTPVYFWLISIFYLVTNSSIGIFFIHSLLHAFIPIFSYFSLKRILNKEMAVFIAIFTALSPTLIVYSLHIAQYTLLPFFTSLSFLIASYLVKLKAISNRQILLSIVAFIPALYLHNSAVPIFIGFSLFWIYLSKERKTALLSTVLFLTLVTIIFILLSYQGNYMLFFNFIDKISKFESGINSKSISDKLYEIVNYLIHESMFFSLGLVLGTIGITSKVLSKKNFNIRNLIIFMPVLFLIVSLLAPMNEFYERNYIAPYYMLFLYFISFLIFLLPKKIHKFLVIILISIVVFENRWEFDRHYVFENPLKVIEHSGFIVDSKFTQNNIQILLPLSERYDLPRLSSWFGPSAVASSNKKISLVDSDVSLNNLAFAYSGSGLLICIDNKYNSFLSHERCLSDFQTYSRIPVTLESIINKNDVITYFFYSFNELTL